MSGLLSKDWVVWQSVNEKGRKKSRKKKITSINHSNLFVLYISLTIFGLLMIASSSSYEAMSNYNNMFYFLQRQGIFVFVSMCLGYVIIRIPVIFWEKIGLGLLLLCIIALLLVFFINDGAINGSYRWIKFGLVSVQPSEFTKIAIIIYLAGYLVRNQDKIKTNLPAFVRPIILVLLVSNLVLIEPDLSGTLILLLITTVLVFIGGVSILRFLTFTLGVVVISGLATFSLSYRSTRITALTENIMESVNTYDSNYQILQSLVAFGQGQLTGLGFGSSRQKLLYLPEVHTDFIFAIIAEELGLIGIIGLISLYIMFIGKIFLIAHRATFCSHTFAALFSYGYATLISFHVFINIAVTMRLLPTTGITLPFISYGGSSFLAFSIGLAIMLRIEYELYPQPKPTRIIRGSA